MKHKKAIYYNKDGNRKIFEAKLLNEDKNSIVELKKYNLLDVTEEFELCIVDNTTNDKISHFRLINSENDSRFYNGYDSKRHDEKIIDIIEKFTVKNVQINVSYKDFSLFEKKEKSLIELNDYVFKDEVYKETEKNKPYARYDIYGMDKSLIISQKRPEIIIEVVDENFQNKDLFNFLIQKTTTNSVLILYYFMEKDGYYNKCSLTNNKIEFRVSCYIQNGIFYYCGIPLIVPNHFLQDEIDNPYLYFNYVEQKIIKPMKKGKDVAIRELK